MKRAIVLCLGISFVLTGCGGSRPPADTNLITTPRASATGPINSACLASDRKARSAQLCGCIQVAADLTLTSSQQQRAVAFYRDPHSAQVVRQSDSASDERFWEAYANYSEQAKALCG